VCARGAVLVSPSVAEASLPGIVHELDIATSMHVQSRTYRGSPGDQ
jgi:hypothetical protein